MTSIPASARTTVNGSAPAPAHSARAGLVIEHLDALPDTQHALFTVCAVTQLAEPAAPAAGLPRA
ncbi:MULTISPECIES: hypothetical protein [Streptomyces]|uniref:hypothetical protein n=1 Tax=Streptomyces TaxID=1883 RepID=UPI000F73BA90|nr:hypothetical protein [Streptomyces sp. WAC05292]RSS91962.1 hypothetical protein EF903_10325 [Streptomyces sp. WAC05292]